LAAVVVFSVFLVLAGGFREVVVFTLAAAFVALGGFSVTRAALRSWAARRFAAPTARPRASGLAFVFAAPELPRACAPERSAFC
jgi:hypothetical protein